MARPVDLARILALCIDAGQEWSTVIVNSALSFDCFGRYDAGYMAISPAGWQAGALRLVVDAATGGKLRTCV